MKISRLIILGVLLPLLIVGCDSSNPKWCFDQGDTIAQKDVETPAFNEINVRENIQLFLKEGPQRIEIVTAQSVIDEVKVIVQNGILTLIDPNRCDLLTASEPTKIYVTAPNINRIRNASQYEVSSVGILRYERLVLVSDNNEGAQYSIADFRLDIEVGGLEIVANNFSNFFLSGKAQRALIGFYGGANRFEGAQLKVNDLRVFHRGSNEMIVYPLDKIEGQLVSSGDVIAKNRPEVVDVEVLFTGRLRFED